MLAAVVEERVIRFRPRTIFIVIGIVLAIVLLVEILLSARQVLTWIVISAFLALARDLVARLESGELEPTAGAVEPYAHRRP